MYVTLSKINKTTSCQGHIEYNTSVIICTAKKKNHKRTEVNEIEKKKFWIKFSMIYLNSQYPEPTNGTAIMNINYI